eukprot:2239320-Amphidinium_carterae.1
MVLLGPDVSQHRPLGLISDPLPCREAFIEQGVCHATQLRISQWIWSDLCAVLTRHTVPTSIIT